MWNANAASSWTPLWITPAAAREDMSGADMCHYVYSWNCTLSFVVAGALFLSFGKRTCAAFRRKLSRWLLFMSVVRLDAKWFAIIVQTTMVEASRVTLGWRVKPFCNFSLNSNPCKRKSSTLSNLYILNCMLTGFLYQFHLSYQDLEMQIEMKHHKTEAL